MAKYQQYNEYKDSGVVSIGLVPKNWSVSRLKQVVDQNRQVTYGIVQAGPNVKEGVYYIRPADMTEETGVKNYENLLKTSPEIAASYERSKIKAGDIICSIGPSFGKLMITPEYLDGANLTQGTARVAISSEYNTGYFFWALRSTCSFQQWESSVGGATFRALNLGPLADTFLVIPTNGEQTQIANFLDHETAKIDTLIDKQQTLIRLLQEKRQAVISHAVTKGLNPDAPMKDSGVEWLGEVPEHWVVAQLKFNTLVMQTGPFGSQLHAEEYIEDGIPLINPAHMIDGEIVPDSRVTVDEATQERLERHKLSEGDIIFARRGELGRCAIVHKHQEGWICGTGSLRATLNDKLISEYAYLLITSDGLISELSLESKGSTMDNLNTETLGRVRMPVPPRNEQNEIISHVRQVFGKYKVLIGNAEQAIQLMQERRTALISAAVTGKIDVRGWRASDIEVGT